MFVRLLALLSVCLPLWADAAEAQSEKILIVGGSNVPEKLQVEVSNALDDVASVMSSSGYVGNLRARHQAPDSEEALSKLAPQMGATLIVVLELSHNKLEIAYRNGRNGRVIDEDSVPARGKHPKLPGPAKHKIATSAKRAMSKVGPAPAPERASAAEPVSQKPSRPVRPGQPVHPTQAQPVEEEEEEEEEDEGASKEAAAEEQNKAKPSGDEGIAFLLHAGGGLGSRTISVPSGGGGSQIATGLAPALDVGLGVEIALGEKWQVHLLVDYRTVFGLSAPYLSAVGAPLESSLTTHSVMAGASLGLLTNGPDSFGFHVFLAWAYRGMSAAEASLPSASVQGPVIRPEFHIPFANGVVTLRLAPEFILIINATATLPHNVNGLQAIGFAFGGEASLDFRISKAVKLGALFRESQGSVPSGWGTSMVENERYIIGRLLLHL